MHSTATAPACLGRASCRNDIDDHRHGMVSGKGSAIVRPSSLRREIGGVAPLGGKPPSFASVWVPYPFRALREPDRRRRDGEGPEQRSDDKPKTNYLTGKAPYKFESISPLRRVRTNSQSLLGCSLPHALERAVPADKIMIEQQIATCSNDCRRTKSIRRELAFGQAPCADLG